MDIVDIFMTRALSGMVVPCLYYTNTWYSKYLPYVFFFFLFFCFAIDFRGRMSTRISYDNTGAAYNVSRIINSDASFNSTAYEEYSPLFLS